jgi:hypothetical protein
VLLTGPANATIDEQPVELPLFVEIVRVKPHL